MTNTNTSDLRSYLATSQAAREFARTLSVGDRITTAAAFTSPIGCHFRAGDAFIVEHIGEVNTRCYAVRCGSVVWLSGGVFVTSEAQS